MKLKTNLLTPIALSCGILSLALRTLLFLTGIDQKGLVITSHPANSATYILIAIAMVLIFLISRQAPQKSQYPFRTNRIAGIGSMVGGLGILITTFSEFPASKGMIALLTCLLGLVAGGCMILAGVLRWQGKPTSYWLHSAVCAYLMVHILSQYQGWNHESQLQFYLPQLLASVFLMLCAYQRAAIDADAGDVRTFLFFNYGALFFSCLAIGSVSPIFYIGMATWTVSVACTPKELPEVNTPELPEPVLTCIQQLEENGYTAYAVGGCIRDHLLGLVPHDYDLCTNAKPEDICRIFEQYPLVRSGEKHGTIGVVLDGTVYEITTYRTEGGYSDSRHPDWVEFVDNIEADLARRDFTVNAMAYSPTRGFADPFEGRKDLENKVLRAVGEPEARFREDALRILRGVRFAARFQLTPDKATEDAMLRCAPLMEALAAERIYTELMGYLPYAGQEDLQRFAPILATVIPELRPCIGFNQNNPHHIHDVYTHTACTVAAAPADATLRLAALLHDIGKPETYSQDEAGIGHFYGHETKSAEMANTVLMRLKAPTAVRKQVVELIENHMVVLQAEGKFLRRRCAKFGIDTVEAMLWLQRSDMIGTGTRTEADLQEFDRIAQLLGELRESESCLQIKDLAIDGKDLMELGIAAGPAIGQCLSRLLELVVDQVLPNEREALLTEARKTLDGGNE